MLLMDVDLHPRVSTRFDYVIEHIGDEKNVFADKLMRWERVNWVFKAVLAVRILLQVTEQVVPSAFDIVWPTSEVLLESQRISKRTHGQGTKDGDGIIRVGGKILVPDDNAELTSSFPHTAGAWDIEEPTRQRA